MASHGCGVPDSPLTLSEWYFGAAAQKIGDQAVTNAHFHPSAEYFKYDADEDETGAHSEGAFTRVVFWSCLVKFRELHCFIFIHDKGILIYVVHVHMHYMQSMI